jgi:hypothetical protein
MKNTLPQAPSNQLHDQAKRFIGRKPELVELFRGNIWSIIVHTFRFHLRQPKVAFEDLPKSSLNNQRTSFGFDFSEVKDIFS